MTAVCKARRILSATCGDGGLYAFVMQHCLHRLSLEDEDPVAVTAGLGLRVTVGVYFAGELANGHGLNANPAAPFAVVAVADGGPPTNNVYAFDIEPHEHRIVLGDDTLLYQLSRLATRVRVLEER